MADHSWEIIFLCVVWNVALLSGVSYYGQTFDENGVLRTINDTCVTNCTDINNPPTDSISFLEGISYGLGGLADDLGWFFVFFFVVIWEVILGILVYRLLRGV